MYPPITHSALLRYLQVTRPDLAAKVIELRDRVSLYLRGVQNTFQHYTSHAIDHSDQIVRELSNLLFDDPEDLESISVKLSGIETYLLLLSAYTHDAGMVVSDEEKLEALSSPTWQEFAATNHIVEADISAIVSTVESVDGQLTAPQDLFVRALEQRLLLADFFRQRHATRATGAISGALAITADFLAGDPSAEATLTALCVGHGLNRAELASDTSYPTRRDIFGEGVNVRLLAILLRLGDLLDMRYDRACPLIRSIASPIPPSSDVHWNQYGRIKGRITSPSRIDIHAECETAHEHRVLRDWCTWIADEIRDAPKLLAGSLRHQDWRPPKATLGGSHDTIQIVRAPGARYRAEDWRFTFDENEIVVRLVRDVHRHPLGFLRELLQNALDATRTRAYYESGSSERFPNELEQSVREGLPVRVILTIQGSDVISIEVSDEGIGMTEDIVKNYFLQIGRSWYRSSDFSQAFHFAPTSRFGIGFLSVFAVSEDVKVETRWHLSPPQSSLAMQLPGPKSYLLFEDTARSSPGTSVTVRLTQTRPVSEVLNYLRACCVANEFPVLVSTVEGDSEIQRHKLPSTEPSQTIEVPISESVMYRTHKVQVTLPGVFGFVEFSSICVDGVDDWSLGRERMEAVAARSNPLGKLPELGGGWTAINGLASEDYVHMSQISDDGLRWELDIRGADAASGAGLDRLGVREHVLLNDDLAPILDGNLSQGQRSDSYRGGMARRFRTLAPNWSENVPFIPQMGGPSLSRVQLRKHPVFFASFRSWPDRVFPKVTDEEENAALEAFYAEHCVDTPLLKEKGLNLIHGGGGRTDFDRQRSLERVFEISSDLFVGQFASDDNVGRERNYIPTPEFEPDSSVVAVKYVSAVMALNASHPLIQAVGNIPTEYAHAKSRILQKIAKPYLAYNESLESMIRGVGGALNDRPLLAFADCLHHMELRNYSALECLRVPRHPEPSESEPSSE